AADSPIITSRTLITYRHLGKMERQARTAPKPSAALSHWGAFAVVNGLRPAERVEAMAAPEAAVAVEGPAVESSSITSRVAVRSSTASAVEAAEEAPEIAAARAAAKGPREDSLLRLS